MARDGAARRDVARGGRSHRCYGVGVPHHRFFCIMGLAAIAVAIVGFVPGLVKPTRLGPVTPLVALHAALAAAWLLLFLAQTTLIARDEVRTHRRLGVAGVCLAVAFVVTGYMATIAAARRGYDLSGDLRMADDRLGSLVFPLGDLVSFSVLVTLAVVWRRGAARARRRLVLATVGALMGAPLAHAIAQVPALQGVPPIILLPLSAFYFASAVHDWRTTGRPHAVSLWGAFGLLVWAQGRAAIIGPSEAWRGFAAWLVD
jgi:hypothetical protein